MKKQLAYRIATTLSGNRLFFSNQRKSFLAVVKYILRLFQKIRTRYLRIQTELLQILMGLLQILKVELRLLYALGKEERPKLFIKVFYLIAKG